MQNISHVLALMGRDWIPGLPPPKNVGVRVTEQIETLICELEGRRESAEGYRSSYGRQAWQDAEATPRRKQNAPKDYINHDQHRTGSAGQSMGAGASKWDMRGLRPTGSVYRRRRLPISGGPSSPQTCGRRIGYANEYGCRLPKLPSAPSLLGRRSSVPRNALWKGS